MLGWILFWINFFAATTEQVSKAKEVIKQLTLGFNSSHFENPCKCPILFQNSFFLIALFNGVFPLLLVALQKHFKNLEALALDRDEPEEVIDFTGKQTLFYRLHFNLDLQDCSLTWSSAN